MIACADARHIPLPDESVQCVITSPPYWGLRKYAGKQELVWGGRKDCEHEWETECILGQPLRFSDKSGLYCDGRPEQSRMHTITEAASKTGGQPTQFVRAGCALCGAWRGAYGLEPTVEMYIQHTVEILREIRRVLRSDGVCFWNVGDSYFNCTYIRDKAADAFANAPGYSAEQGGGVHSGKRRSMARTSDGLKMKDLCLIPQRVALAAQADGWWVRSDIIWAKPNPMPESVYDRPTDAYEHILLLTKNSRYYWDAEAVKESLSEETLFRAQWPNDLRPGGKRENGDERGMIKDGSYVPPDGKRNLRNVWTFPTQPYKGAHFATFPEELPRRCILAATSSHGACVECAAPWQRIVKKPIPPKELRTLHHGPDDGLVKGFGSSGARYGAGQKMQDWLDAHPAKTIGWQPNCVCGIEKTAPCLVLDPFAGSGTTGRVAIELNRRPIMLDLAYFSHAEKRTRNVQREMALR